jgi:hypothetical protein
MATSKSTPVRAPRPSPYSTWNRIDAAVMRIDHIYSMAMCVESALASQQSGINSRIASCVSRHISEELVRVGRHLNELIEAIGGSPTVSFADAYPLSKRTPSTGKAARPPAQAASGRRRPSKVFSNSARRLRASKPDEMAEWLFGDGAQ